MKNRLRLTRWTALALCVSTPHLMPTPHAQWLGALLCVAVAALSDFVALHGD